MKKWLKSFSLFDLLLCSLMAALGIAVKSVVVPLVHIITGALLIPGGALAGGFYMLFLVLACCLTHRLGAASVTALVQAILVMVTGLFGSHGVMSLVTYFLPGLAIDFVMFLTRHRGGCITCCFVGGMAANVVGTVAVNFTFFDLPLVPLLLSLALAALSGGLGGLLAYSMSKKLHDMGVIKRVEGVK